MPRERKPFSVVDSDGNRYDLIYDAPYSEKEHDEMAMLKTLPWFESGKPLKNWYLHDIDFYDEVDKIWGKKWGAEGIGRLREVLISRPTENEIRPEYGKEPLYYYSTSVGTASLNQLRDQFELFVTALKENGVRLNFVEPPVPAIGPYGYLKNMVTLAGAGIVVKGGAIVHRYALGSWQRGREQIWEKALVALSVPIYLTFYAKGICEPGGGIWLDGKRFVFNESVVANMEGLRQLKWVFDTLGFELIVCHSPGWMNYLNGGNIGTSHADMFMMNVDLGLAIIYPDLVNYDLLKYLMANKVRLIEVPPEEYWELAVNGVLLEAGKVIMNSGAKKTIAALRKEGVDVIEVDFRELHKYAIAGLDCATCKLIRDQPSPLLEELKK